MGYVIIGIHGRAPKPPAQQLATWFHAALVEGLRRNEGRTSDDRLRFELAYYADVFEPALTNDPEPYTPAEGQEPLPDYRAGFSDHVIKGLLEVSGWTVDAAYRLFGLDGIANAALRKTLEDVHQYYTDGRKREAVQERFRSVLEAHLGKDRVMVLAHSMGAIVAYDVIRALGRKQTRASGTVQHFVTLGSPLGLPHVKAMLGREYDLVRTPSLVERWTNHADRRDYVALDAHLRDDFAANADGVRVEDDAVWTVYQAPSGQTNPHKSYGYLRTPELSRLVRQFI